MGGSQDLGASLGSGPITIKTAKIKTGLEGGGRGANRALSFVSSEP